MSSIHYNKSAAREFAADLKKEMKHGHTRASSEWVARRLGSHAEGDRSTFLIWHSDIEMADRVTIDLYLPLADINFDKPDQHAGFKYHSFEIETYGSFACAVFEGLPSGNRKQFGVFYEFRVFTGGESKIIRDPMAWSMPYGIYAPAELYDAETVRESRKDLDYFKKLQAEINTSDGRITPSVNLLEVHPGSTTREGTLHSLTKRYKQIAAAIKAGEELSPDEKNLIGFDGIELMPIEPVIEHPEKHRFWEPFQGEPDEGEEITVHLRKPSVINWGYDIVIFGSAAVNPSLLSTGRPHELLELIETLHNFPDGPIKVVLDVVYGHADNQGVNVLPEPFFAGDNMYGKNINFRHPLIREIILEMQRRKIDWGFDGVRVDGAQDFKYYDAEQDIMYHDDDYLRRMSDVVQNVGGIEYRPWMIFEDGRPWPADDWELSSTYREITEQQGHPQQWASMIFAYNTPYNYTYWVSKWWRLKELFDFGDKWITGYANHDTMRRGTQADPSTININTRLGNSLRMVMDNAYNNPATTLMMNCFLPGTPMDFVQALAHTPWTFMRNTDTTYALKVAAEEAYFTEWQITDVDFRRSRFFRGMKEMGFTSIDGLRRFSQVLLRLLKATDDNHELIAELLNRFDPPFEVMDWDPDKLNRYAEIWTADVYHYCNADRHSEFVDPNKAEFNLLTRRYRHNNPWLIENFSENDMMRYREPVDGSVIYYGYRKAHESNKEILFLANMEGHTRQPGFKDLDLPVTDLSGFKAVLKTPSLRSRDVQKPIRLSAGQAILFERKPE